MTNIGMIIALGITIIWSSLGLTMLISSIQGIVYAKKHEAREREYHEERMKILK